jgi:hypothetical protein
VRERWQYWNQSGVNAKLGEQTLVLNHRKLWKRICGLLLHSPTYRFTVMNPESVHLFEKENGENPEKKKKKKKKKRIMECGPTS